MIGKQSRATLIGGIIIFTVVFLILYFGLPFLSSTTYDASVKSQTSTTSSGSQEKVFVATHVETPKAVKGFYMTACVAGTPSWRERMAELIKTTELNSVVIDIKDYSGTISFVDPVLQGDDVTGCRVADMKEFIARLHKDNIYVIGRVTVFQDPYYAKRHPELAVKSKSTGGMWKDKKGLPFVDVGAKPYWDHVVDIAKASYALGYDEINFDYIRYPSDGNMADAKYSWTVGTSSKATMVENFFSYLHSKLKDTGMKTSADLFGLVTVAQDDLGIGQVLERALPHFDYIYPMVYPSHFATGSGGFKKPAENPYGIIKYSMEGGIAKEIAWNIANGRATSTPSKLRPWLQDFDLGANYGVAEVQAQIKATYDVGLTSWLLWDASNKYTPSALRAE
jgi:hypothetical protein